ncbi:succinate dehydrogenase, cytochrome b556 subunit [Pseudohaliea rubra]|uniref:Succinate dehydrogenase cytochrome b556 subunit n=1 Tax=Pseudohaliea rubra DSM 19751 TaxID=1265313 RepID=A0A095XUR0_9GAMM|nr:succinate dehydrogenase, cytochrome b556 subunit [Pseudohaliea rubra]KGE03431.1 Succinate dehydrogenase cytochrome b-556 subunit [Pseudohaliea rubra DSM 19751]
MKDNRPVNLDIGSMRLPITAWASISHRISGVVLFAASFGMLWALDISLASAEGFARLGELLGSVPAKVALWAVGTALIYHSLAGIKHLVMDFGIGESMEGGILGSRLVIAASVIISVLLGVSLW